MKANKQDSHNPTEFLQIISLDSISEEEIKNNLTPIEKALYQKIIKNKKLDWLLGRTATKQSVQKYFYTKGNQLSPEQIEVTNKESGAPAVNIDNPNIKTKLYVSISHCENIAVANVADTNSCLGIGVDIEKIRQFAPETMKAFMTKQEYSALKSIAPEKQPLYSTITWSVKESLLKAWGTGLTKHPKSLELTFLDPTYTNIIISHTESNKEIEANISWTKYQASYIIINTVLL